MKKFRVHIAPVLLALGLWLLGNGMMIPHQARGDEEMAGGYIKCKHYFVAPELSSCPKSPIKGKCQGDYTVDVSEFKACTGPPTASAPCQHTTKSVIIREHHGKCIAKKGLCVHGPDMKGWPKDFAQPPVPWCNNSGSTVASLQKKRVVGVI